MSRISNRWLLAIGIVASVVCLVAIGSWASAEESTTPTPVETVVVTETVTATPRPTATVTVTATATPTKTEEPEEPVVVVDDGPEWVKIITFSGSEYRTSKPFKVRTDEQKIVVEQEKDVWASITVFIYQPGDDEYYIDEFSLDEGGKESSRMYLDPGEYYFDVLACNGDWKVTLYEWK